MEVALKLVDLVQRVVTDVKA